MKRCSGAAAFVLVSSVAWADAPKVQLHVDCAAAPEGTGTGSSPFATIGAAVAYGKPLSATQEVVIHVAPGVCASETFPMALDYAVTLVGSREGDFDAEGFPLGTQAVDTLIEGTGNPSALFLVTGDDVTIARLSLDAKHQPLPRGPVGPIGIHVVGADRFAVKEVRVVRSYTAVHTTASSGDIKDSWFGTARSMLVLFPGDSSTSVKVAGNRVEDAVTGAIAIVGSTPSGTTPTGTFLRATVVDNDFHTAWLNTGASNPYGIRIDLFGTSSPFVDARIEATLERNRIRGTYRYGILVSGGQTVLRDDGQHLTGAVVVHAADNVIEETVTKAATIISFTNVRATELPCELDPASVRGPDCPSLAPANGPPFVYWDYLFGASFEIDQSGEFDGGLVDHPEYHPITGVALDNVLVLDDEVADHETFVVVP